MHVVAPTVSEVRTPRSVDEVVAELAELGPDAIPLAGGTWIMRRPPSGVGYVALGGVPGLYGVSRPSDGPPKTVLIGAMTTHSELARTGGGPSPDALAGVRAAAARSAFPQIRNVATVGGNLCAAGFAEADLVPGLLAAEALVLLATPDRRIVRSVREHLDGSLAPGELVLGVEVPVPDRRRSGFARLTVREAGEYAIANVAVSVDLTEEGIVWAARVAVGGVEPVARLCPGAARVLVGRSLGADAGIEAGHAAAAECRGRDGRDAPGWYRLAVLPALCRSAVAEIIASRLG